VSGNPDETAPAATDELYGAPPVEETPAPESRPAPRPAGNRTMLLVIVAVIVVVLLLVAGLYIAGVGPFSRSSSSPAVVGDTFSKAAVAANQSANGFGGSPWKTMLAAGADPQVSLLESTAFPSSLFSSQGLSGCVGTDEDNATSAVTFSSIGGNLSAGASPNWLFVLVNGSGALMFTLVLNGQATILEVYSGAGCSAIAQIATLPPGTIDSSTAVRAAMTDGGYAFVNAHPGGFLTYSASDLSGAGVWFVSYSTCPADGSGTAGSTYYTFNATVGLTNGSVVGPPVAGTPACGGLDLSGGLSGIGNAASLGGTPGGGHGTSGTPINTALSISGVTSGDSTNYYYNVKVLSASPTLVIGDLEFAILNASGKVPSGPYAVQIDASSGCGVAFGALNDPIYLAPFNDPCTTGTTGGSAYLTAGETISVLSMSSLMGLGDQVVVYGESPYGGNVTASIA
jgi:hypothetical protein